MFNLRKGRTKDLSPHDDNVQGFTEAQLDSLRIVLSEFHSKVAKEVVTSLEPYLKKDFIAKDFTASAKKELIDGRSAHLGKGGQKQDCDADGWLHRHRRPHQSTAAWLNPTPVQQASLPKRASGLYEGVELSLNDIYSDIPSKPLIESSHDDDESSVADEFVPSSEGDEGADSLGTASPSSWRLHTSESNADILANRRRNKGEGRRDSLATEYDSMMYISGNVMTPVRQLVTSLEFNNCIALMVLLNSLYIGFETDYMARNWTDSLPYNFFYVDVVFCLVFLFEVSLRLYTFGNAMWTTAGWKWNALDFAMVSLQVADVLMGIFARLMKLHASSPESYYFLRMVRIFRLFRVLRIIRMLSIFTELKMIVVTVAESLRSLFWTMVMVILVMYVCGIYLTQIVTDHKILHKDEAERKDELERFYGDLPTSMLTLYETISEGVHWGEVVAPLRDGISPWMSLIFSVYIAFAVFAMMNVITGIFVDSALVAGHNDKRKSLMIQMRELFKRADIDNSGMLTKEKFLQQLETKYAESLLKESDLEVSEAEDLFKLLDINQENEITVDDFVHGCVRVTGYAKAIDLITLMQEYRIDRQRTHQQFNYIEDLLQNIHSFLHQLLSDQNPGRFSGRRTTRKATLNRSATLQSIASGSHSGGSRHSTLKL